MVSGDEAEVVVCSGELSISRAEELRDALMAALDAGRPVTVDCAAATQADLSFVQLLLAARSSAARRGLSLTVTGGEGALAATLRAGGIRTGDGGI